MYLCPMLSENMNAIKNLWKIDLCPYVKLITKIDYERAENPKTNEWKILTCKNHDPLFYVKLSPLNKWINQYIY